MVPSVAKRLPWLKILALAEVALLAQRHVQLLGPTERRRFAVLAGRALRDRRLGPQERAELTELLKRMEPRAFMGGAIHRMSPVPLPKRLLFGKGKKS
jgi:hypothetical protein